MCLHSLMLHLLCTIVSIFCYTFYLLSSLLPKRADVLNYLKGKNCQIYCLQDTHFSPGIDEKFVQSQWNSNCYFSSYKSNARGVAILFAKNFEYKVHKSINDPEGNFLLLDITVFNN